MTDNPSRQTDSCLSDSSELASPIIRCPDCECDLPTAFQCCGTLDPSMWVRECYVLSGTIRRDADTVISKAGEWHAVFSNVPESPSAILFVIAEDANGIALVDFSDRLTIDSNTLVDPCQEEMAELHKFAVHLGTPQANSHWAGTAANGTLDGGTLLSNCWFLCPGAAKKFPDSKNVAIWNATFSGVANCAAGTFTALGNDNTMESHGNITVP